MLMDEDLQRLWSLLAELSGQLTANREQCEALKRQTDELKRQAVHTGTGYVLRRFNVDLSQEQFESELERMNAQLVVENQTLQHENRQLSVLLKDYETTLEQVMSKFRAHAHSTQTHELDLIRYYEQLVIGAREQSSAGNDALGLTLANPALLPSLQRLSALVQRALRSLQGEDDASLSPPSSSSPSSSSSSSEAGGDAMQVETPPSRPVEPVQLVSPPSNPHSIEPSLLPSAAYRPRARDPSSGGYVGTRGTAMSDPALRAAIELETLRKENVQLRELLGIAEEIDPMGTDGGAAGGGEWAEGENRRRGSAESEDAKAAMPVPRTGAGVVVPEELIKGAEIDAMEGRAQDGILSDSQI